MILREGELETLCEIARTAAQKAGQYIQSQFDQHYDKMHKEAGESQASQVLTSVDLKAQEIILNHLKNNTSIYDFGLLTEEAADDQSRLEKDYFWCIDPMDGTLAFAEGRTGYAVSIALISRIGDPVIGVVYIPDLEETYTAIKGKGVYLNDKPFKRPEEKVDHYLHFYIDKSLQSESHYNSICKYLENWSTEKELKIHLGFGAVRNAIGVMNSDTACYVKLAKNAIGGGSIWDYASTRLFFEELGLAVSDSFGKKLELNDSETTFMNHKGVLYATDPLFIVHMIPFSSQ